METTGNIGSILLQKGNAILSVGPETTVFEAIEIMSERNVGALLVMENEFLCGIVSERDYTRQIILKGRSSKNTAVRDIMTTPVTTVTPMDSVENCMRLVTEQHIRHLPVMEGDDVLGVISIGDLVRWTISAQSATIDQLTNFIVGTYPG